jgi:hypothetical protein
VVRSLSEAPRYASVISDILRNRVHSEQYLPGSSQGPSPSMLGTDFFRCLMNSTDRIKSLQDEHIYVLRNRRNEHNCLMLNVV